MLTRFLRFVVLLPLAALLLGACVDVADEPPATPAMTKEPAQPGATLASSHTPAARATATMTPTPRPRATVAPSSFKAPAGTTGLVDLVPGPVEFSDACLDGSYDETGRIESNSVPDSDEPQPYKPIAFTENDGLQHSLDNALGDEADDYAYVVKDLTTGVGATHNADKLFNSASVFKLWVMYEAFHQESLGLLNWSDELVITPYYDGFGLSPRRTQLCQQLTVADAMDAMLSISDNAAAVLLQDVVGASNVNRAIDALGVRDSGLFEDGLPLTASDVSLLLEAIGRGQAISSAASAEMLWLMSREGIDNGLEAGVPAGTLVAHKTGNWSDATHDVGIVYGPKGPYLFVALSDTDHETAVIKALSQAAWSFYSE